MAEAPKKVSMYDPQADAFREVDLSRIITSIKESKKLERDLLAKGVITEKEVAVD